MLLNGTNKRNLETPPKEMNRISFEILMTCLIFFSLPFFSRNYFIQDSRTLFLKLCPKKIFYQCSSIKKLLLKFQGKVESHYFAGIYFS